MPSDNWIAAASKTGRVPVICMAIQSVNALSATIDTTEQWQLSTSQSNVNMLSPENNPDTVILTTNGTEANAGVYPAITRTPSTFAGPIYPADLPFGLGGMGGTTSAGVYGYNERTCGANFSIQYTSRTYPSSLAVTMWGCLNGGTPQNLATQTFDVSGTFPFIVNGLTPGTWYFYFTAVQTGTGGDYDYYDVVSFICMYQTSYAASGYLRTASLDLTSTPSVNSIVNIGQTTVASECSLAFELYGSNDNSTWIDLGSVNDGSSVAPYRYYQFGCTFTSNTIGQGVATGSPILSSVGITGGNSQFTYYSTNPDIPVVGSLPYLLPDIGTLGSTLTLMDLGTTGQVTPNLYYLEDTFNLIQTGYLRNKTVQLLYGFNGLGLGDFEPVFTGLWYDGTIDLVKGIIGVKTRTMFSMFQKVQLPQEKALDGLRDDITCPPVNWISVNIIQAMLDCLDSAGLPERYVDSTRFNALMTGYYAAPEWNVSRRVDFNNKVDVVELLKELSVLSGVFLLQLPNGMISPIQYNPAAEQVCQITPDLGTFGQVSLGQADLFTRQQMLYTPKHQNDLDVGVARGTWANESPYLVGMCVIDTLTGIIYHCWVVHNSTDNDQPGYGSGWRSRWFVRWTAATAYSSTTPVLLTDPENTIVHQKTVYVCIANIAASQTMEPGVTTGWASYWVASSVWSSGVTTSILQAGETFALDAAGDYPDPWLWAPNMDFTRADTIYRAGVLYRCLQNHNSGAALAGANPTEPAVGTARRSYWATEWISGTNYQNGDTVTCQGPLYVCYASHVAGPTNEPAVGVNCQTYWYWTQIKPGTSADDFYNAYILINNAAEINWGLNADVPPGDPDYQVNPGYQRNWYDMWNATPSALQALALRMDSWFANPLMKVKVSKLPPLFYQYPLGSMVGVSGLMLPSSGAAWGLPCYLKQFMIMNVTLDPKNCTVSFDLLEVQPIPDTPVFNPLVGMVLSWSNANNAQWYTLYMTSDGTAPTATNGAQVQGVISPITLTGETGYQYALSATNLTGTSALSNIVTIP